MGPYDPKTVRSNDSYPVLGPNRFYLLLDLSPGLPYFPEAGGDDDYPSNACLSTLFHYLWDRLRRCSNYRQVHLPGDGSYAGIALLTHDALVFRVHGVDGPLVLSQQAILHESLAN